MTVYLVVLLLAFFLRFINFNKKDSLLIIFIALFFVSAFRDSSVGVDTIQYYQKYMQIGNYGGWNYNQFRYEPGFFYLCKLLNYISHDPQTLLIVTSAFINLAVYLFIKKNSENYFLSSIIYILFNIYFSTMNTLREWIAISFILFGFNFLIEKKYFRFSIFLILGICFHTAAWAAILLLFVAVFRERKWIYPVLLLASIVIFFAYSSFYNFLSSLFGYENYNNKFIVSNYYGALLLFVESLVLLVILYLYSYFNGYFTSIIHDKKNSIFLACSIIYLGFLAIVMRVNLFNRISGFYEVFIIITIPNLLSKISVKRDKFVLELGIIITITTSFLVIGLSRPEWLGCIPYVFFK